MSYNTLVHVKQGGSELALEPGAAVYSETLLQATIVTATLAEVNASKVAIAGVAGRKIRVIGVRALSTGAFGGLTLLTLQSSAGSPVIVTSYTQATLTNGAIFSTDDTITGQTLGAGFEVALGDGESLVISKTGSAATTATSIKFTILYQLLAA